MPACRDIAGCATTGPGQAMTSSRRRKNAITLPIPQPAELAALLTTIDEFLRSAHADGALASALSSSEKACIIPSPCVITPAGSRTTGAHDDRTTSAASKGCLRSYLAAVARPCCCPSCCTGLRRRSQIS